MWKFRQINDVRVVYIDFYEPTDENNDDDDSFSDYVPVSEQIEPGPVENGKIENDVEIKHENGEKTTEKVGKSQIVKTFRLWTLCFQYVLITTKQNIELST